MRQETIQIALKSFLGIDQIARLPDGQHLFVTALESVTKQYPMLAPLDALFSEDTATFALHRAERDTLLMMLRKSLAYDRDSHVFSAFHEKILREQYAEYQKTIDPRSLRLLHGDVNNLGVSEKFLLGKLGRQAWLTDLDLKRCIQQFAVQDTVRVTRLNAADIGMALHFARREHLTKNTKKAPYAVQLILNKGTKGDITSQGVHWIEAQFIIDPSKTPNTITVQYSDSLPMSEEEVLRVENIIRSGLLFSEQGQTDAQDLQAFPGADISFAREAVTAQPNGWSCGYYALQNALKRIPDLSTSPALTELFSADNPTALRTALYRILLNDMALPSDLPAAVTRQLPASIVSTLQAKTSRADYFDTFLETIDVSSAVAPVDLKTLQQVKADKAEEDKIVKALETTLKPAEKLISVPVLQIEGWKKIVDDLDKMRRDLPNDSATRIDGMGGLVFEIDLRKLFKPKGASSFTPEQLSYYRAAGAAKLIGAIRSSAGENGQYFFNTHGESLDIPASIEPYISREKNANKIEGVQRVTNLLRIVQFEKYQVVTQLNSFKIDLNRFLAEHAEQSAIALTAFVRFCNEQKITCLEISDSLPLTAAHASILEKLKYVKTVTFSEGSEREENTRTCFKHITSRNKLVHFLKIPIDVSDESIWFLFYEARFSNKSLLGSIRESNDIFTLDSGITMHEKMVFYNECLSEAGTAPLQGLLDFLDAKEDFFQKNPKQFTYNTLHLNASGMGEFVAVETPLSDHLSVLRTHLEANRYFPFSSITLSVAKDFFNTESVFEDFLGIVSSLGRYTHFTQFTIKDSNLSEAQYDRLIAVFQAQKLTIRIETSPEYTDKKYALRNTISHNLRLKNIDNRKAVFSRDAVTPVVSHASKVTKPTTPTLSQGSFEQVRLCKVSGFNPLASLSIDVSHQAEKQHQQQAQLQQETQVSHTVQRQSENEVTDSVGFGVGSTAKMKRSDFLDKYASAESVEQQWVQGAARESHLFSFDAFHDPSRGKRTFVNWAYNSFMGQYDLPKGLRYVTPEAASNLLNTPQHFLGGLNFDNLPPGFYVQHYKDAKNPENSGYLLCYDAITFVENRNQSPLTPSVTLRPKWQSWMGDARQFGLPANAFWTVFPEGKTNSPSLHNPEVSALFAQIVNSFNPAYAQLLATYAAYLPPSEDPVAFTTPKEIFALMDIVYHEGVEGLAVFLNAITSLHDSDPDLYAHFKNNFLTTRENYEPIVVMELMTTDNLSLIKKLSDFTPAQKNWWKRIVECEQENSSQVNLSALYNGFQYFLSRLPPGVALPSTCSLFGCNPLVQLDRLLSILGNVDANNVADQLLCLSEKNEAAIAALSALKNAVMQSDFVVTEVIQAQLLSALRLESVQIDPDGILHRLRNQIESLEEVADIGLYHKADRDAFLREINAIIQKEHHALDLTSEGAWYAARWDRFHFVHPRMHLSGDAIYIPGVSAGRSYRVEYSDLHVLAKTPAAVPLENGITAFHRFVGCSGVIATPYDGYIQLMHQLEHAHFSDGLKMKLLPLLALTTTGPRGAVDLDASALIDYVANNKTSPYLSRVFDAIATHLEKLTDKPTIMELTGIVQIAMGASNPERAAKMLLEHAHSDKVLMAFSVWQYHENHLSSDAFLTAFDALKKSDANQFQYTSRVIGLMRSETGHDLTAFTAKMAELKDHPSYQVILPILATIDVKKTPREKLPSSTELITLFDALTRLPSMTSAQAFVWLAQQLPSCVFNRKESVVSGLSVTASDDMADFSAFLKRHHLSAYPSTTITETSLADYRLSLQSEITHQLTDEKLGKIKTKLTEEFERGLLDRLTVETQRALSLIPKEKRAQLEGEALLRWEESIVAEIREVNAMLAEYGSLLQSPELMKKIAKERGLQERISENLKPIDVEAFRTQGVSCLVARYQQVIEILPKIAPHLIEAKKAAEAAQVPEATAAAAKPKEKKPGFFASIGKAVKEAATSAALQTGRGKAEVVSQFRNEITKIAPAFLAAIDAELNSKKEEVSAAKTKSMLSADIEKKLRAEHRLALNAVQLSEQDNREISVKKIGLESELNALFPSYVKYTLLSSIGKSVRAYPQLAKLKSLYPEPVVQESSEDYSRALHHYALPLAALFDVLVTLNEQWRNHLQLEFLLLSPVQAWLTPVELKDIFKAIQHQQFEHIPTQLFSALFPDSLESHVFNITEDARSGFVKGVVAAIEAEGLSLKDKTRLIESLYLHAAHSEKIRELILKLKEVSAHFSPTVFTLWLNAFNNGRDIHYDQSIALLKMPTLSATVLDIILSCFSKNTEKALSDDFEKLLSKINAVDDVKKGKILTILALGALQEDYDASKQVIRDKVFSDRGLLAQLIQLDEARLAQLYDLYSKVPRPRLERLVGLLAKPDDMIGYEKDPFGLRSDVKKLDAQFDLSTIHHRIDALVDLNRGDETHLFRNDRQALYHGIGYVFAVGRHYNLVIPGATDTHRDMHLPAKELSSEQLKQLVQHYRGVISDATHSVDDVALAKLEFVALLREAMYRATGKMPYDTQMMSVLNVLLHGGNVFSEVRTGEGKTIVTALMAALKWAEGGAVDVCSANMALAKRDLAEMHDFFDCLGIKTSVITASSAYEEYQQDGINYSDISELSLWQQQQMLLGKTLPDIVSLIADEVDFNVLDNTTQFRYAASLDASFDAHHNPFADLYPHILDFVKDDALFRNKSCSPLEDIVNLRGYIEHLPGSSLSKTLKNKFAAIPDTTLDRWIDSAFIATQLREDVDYAVRQNTVTRNNEDIVVSEAQVKLNFRVNSQSRFSEGVHQFLHVHLNQRMVSDPAFRKKCHGNAFLIEPEKTYLASRSAKNTIDYYLRGNPPRGNVLGLTGTLGTKADRLELIEKYQARCYKVPPHKTLGRKPLEPILAKDKALFEKIFESIEEAQKNNQCVLVICDGVASSEALHAFLQHKIAADKLQLHNGEQLDQDDEVVAKNAAEIGMVTISTPMFGRGTDIKPKGVNGLHVVTTYLSEEREYGQSIGRAGRNGAKGTDQLIIAEKEFTSRGKKIPPKNNLVAAIKEIRDELALHKSHERYQRERFGDIKDQLFKQFCIFSREAKLWYGQHFPANQDELWKNVSHQNYIIWESFLKYFDKQQNSVLTELGGKTDQALLDAKLHQFFGLIHAQWADTVSRFVEKTNETFFETWDKAYAGNETVIRPELFAWSPPALKMKLDHFSETQQVRYLDLSPDRLAAPLRESKSLLNESYFTYARSKSGSDQEKKNSILFALLNEINSSLFKSRPIQFNAGTDIYDQVQVVTQAILSEYQRIHHKKGVKFPIKNAFLTLCDKVARFGNEELKEVVVNAFTSVDHMKLTGELRSEFDFFATEVAKLQSESMTQFDRVGYFLQKELEGGSSDRGDLIRYHQLDFTSHYQSLLSDDGVMSQQEIAFLERALFYAQNAFLRENKGVVDFQFSQLRYDSEKNQIVLVARYRDQEKHDKQVDFTIDHLLTRGKARMICHHTVSDPVLLESEAPKTAIDVHCKQNHISVVYHAKNDQRQTVLVRYDENNQFSFSLSDVTSAFKQFSVPTIARKTLVDIIRAAYSRSDSLESHVWNQVQFDLLKNHFAKNRIPIKKENVDLLLETAKRCKVVCDLSGLDLSGLNLSGMVFHRVKFDKAILTNVIIDQFTQFKECTFTSIIVDQFQWQKSNKDGSKSSVISVTAGNAYGALQENWKKYSDIPRLNSDDKNDAEKMFHCFQLRHEMGRELDRVYSTLFEPSLAQPLLSGAEKGSENPASQAKQKIIGKVSYQSGVVLDFTGTDLREAQLDSKILRTAKLDHAKLTYQQIVLLIKLGCAHKVIGIDQASVSDRIELSYTDLSQRDLRQLSDHFIITDTTDITGCRISRTLAETLLIDLPEKLATVDFNDLDLSDLDLTLLDFSETTISETTKLNLENATITADQIKQLIKAGCGKSVGSANLSTLDLKACGDFSLMGINQTTRLHQAKITLNQAQWLIGHQLGEKLKDIDLSGQDLRGGFGFKEINFSDEIISENTTVAGAKLSLAQARWLSEKYPALLMGVVLKHSDLRGLDFEKLNPKIVHSMQLEGVTFGAAQLNWMIQHDCKEKIKKANLTEVDFSKINDWKNISLEGAKITADQVAWLIENNQGGLLRDVDLSGADLTNTPNCISYFTDNTQIKSAKITAFQAKALEDKGLPQKLKEVVLAGLDLTALTSQDFFENADLSECRLTNDQLKELQKKHPAKIDRLDLSNTNLSDVNLNKRDLTKTQFERNSINHFTHARLEYAKINQAQLQFLFDHVALRHHLKKINVSGLDLSQIAFEEAFLMEMMQVSILSNARLSNAQLQCLIGLDNQKVSQLHLADTDLKKCDFTGVDLTQTDFHLNKMDDIAGIILTNATINGEQAQWLIDNNQFALLRNVNLSGQDLRKVNLQLLDADILDTIDFTSAKLSAENVADFVAKGLGEKLRGTDLSLATLEHVALTAVKKPSANFREAIIAKETVSPGQSLAGVKIDEMQVETFLKSGRKNLNGVDCSNLQFVKMDFSDADFTGAHFNATTMTDCGVNKRSHFSGAAFQGAMLDLSTLKSFLAAGKEGALQGAAVSFELNGEAKILHLRGEGSLQKCYDYFLKYYKEEKKHTTTILKWHDFGKELLDSKLSLSDKFEKILAHIEQYPERRAAAAFERAMTAYNGERNVEQYDMVVNAAANVDAGSVLIDSNADYLEATSAKTIGFANPTDIQPVVAMCRAFMAGQKLIFETTDKKAETLSEQVKQFAKSGPGISDLQAKNLRYLAALIEWVNQNGGPVVVKEMSETERNTLLKRAQSAPVVGMFRQKSLLDGVPKELLDVVRGVSVSPTSTLSGGRKDLTM